MAVMINCGPSTQEPDLVEATPWGIKERWSWRKQRWPVGSPVDEVARVDLHGAR
jgi:hypothetical protein